MLPQVGFVNYNNNNKKAFRVLVLSILEYAAQVWNPHTKKNIYKLEAIQLRVARWVVALGTIEVHFHGVNHLSNVVVNFFII